MTPLLVGLVVTAGLVIGVGVGAIGAGGSILSVPVLVYGFGQTAVQATTGSLVVVGASAALGAVAARRTGHVQLRRGLVFGLLAVAGAAAGAAAATWVPQQVLLVAYAGLMIVVAGVLALRLVRSRRSAAPAEPARRTSSVLSARTVVAAVSVGVLTGFLGVGGGFLVVPALVLVVGLSMRDAAGTSLVVIALTSAAALAVRLGAGVRPDWGLVLLLTGIAAVGGVVGVRLATLVDTRHLEVAFTALVLAVAAYTVQQTVVPGLA